MSPANDRFQFWFAGHLVATGRSPYDQSAWVAAHATYGDLAALVAYNCPDPQASACLWAYPPWTAWLFAPFGLLDPEPGLAVLRAFLLITAAVAAVMLAGALPLTRASQLVVAFVTVIAAPFVWDGLVGHFEPLLLIGTLLLARGLRESRTAPIAAGAVLLSLKPHLFIALVPLTVALLIRRRSWRTLVVTTLVLLTLVTVGLWLEPGSLAAFSGSGAKAALVLPTTWSFAARVTPGFAAVTTAVLILVSAAAAWVAVRDAPPRRRDLTFVGAATALSLVLTPYLHLYDDVLLAPVIALIIGCLDPRGRRARLVGWGAAFGYVVVTWLLFLNGPHGDEPAVAALVPVATLVGLAIARRAAGPSARRTGSSP